MTIPLALPLSFALCLLFGACTTDRGAALEPSSLDASSEWTWVYVAGMSNPSLSPEGERAFTVLSEAFDKEEIRWAAVGSRGFSISIDSRDLPRGREVLREVVERHNLPVGLARQ